MINCNFKSFCFNKLKVENFFKGHGMFFINDNYFKNILFRKTNFFHSHIPGIFSSQNEHLLFLIKLLFILNPLRSINSLPQFGQ